MFSLVILAVLSGLIAAEVELRLKPLGEQFTKPEGSSMVFTCEVTGDGVRDGVRYGLRWFDRNNNEITERLGRLYVEEERTTMKKLYITDIQKSDEGRYKCTALIDGIQKEKLVNLNLFKDITFENATSPQHPRIYDNALIQCRVTGSPPPVVTWRYKGERIQFGFGSRYTKVDRGIQVRNITLQDNGEYICRAEVESDGRYKEFKILVEVHIPPKIVRGPGRFEGIDGEEISMSCRATGLPSPKYEFYKDGSFFPVQNTTRIKVDSESGVISFHPLNKTDEGRYICRAHNNIDSDRNEGYLTVLVKPNITLFRTVLMNEGERATLLCHSTGTPSPNMTIRKADHYREYTIGPNENGRINIRRFDGGLELTIPSVTPADMSNYTCRSVNSIGMSNHTAAIVVKFQPRFAYNHTRVVYAWAGKTRNITCNVQSYPYPEIDWFRNFRKLVDNDTYRIINVGNEGNLQVKVQQTDQGWIYGNYSCRAFNEMGTRELSIELRRATVPGEPRMIRTVERTPNSVVIDVVPPFENGGEEVLGYRIEYSEKTLESSVFQNSSWRSKPIFDVRDSRITIDNLKPSTTYLFKVRARNDVGIGRQIETTVATETVRVPYAIEIISANPDWGSDYLVKWKKPRTGGLPIKEYEFKFRKVTEGDVVSMDHTDDWQTVKSNDNPDRPMVQYMLRHLMPNSTYQIKMRTRNELGWSSESRPFIFATFQAQQHSGLQSASVGIIVGVVVVLCILMIAIAIDLCCYFINGCGVTQEICIHVCGKKKQFAIEKSAEEGESTKALQSDDEKLNKQNKKAADEQKLKDGLHEGKNDAGDDTKEEITLEEKNKLMDSKMRK